MIELLAAAALAAPCKPPERADVRQRTREVVVYRHKRRWTACSGQHRETFHPSGDSSERLLAVRVAGRRVAVASASRDVVSVRLYDLAGGGQPRTAAATGRLVRLAVDPGGAAAFAVAGKSAREIRVVNRHGSFAVERRVNASLRSLAARGGSFRWRYRAETVSVPALDGPAPPPEHCTIPPGARVLARHPAAVYVLEVARRDAFVMAAHGCAPGGRRWPLGPPREVDWTFGNEDFRVVAQRLPYVALDHHAWMHKSSQDTVRVYDLRTGAQGAEGCLRSYYASGMEESSTALVRTALSATGRLACATETEFNAKVYESSVSTWAAGEERVVHDRAADVDARSMRVDGEELVWTRGGARRSVPFP